MRPSLTLTWSVLLLFVLFATSEARGPVADDSPASVNSGRGLHSPTSTDVDAAHQNGLVGVRTPEEPTDTEQHAVASNDAKRLLTQTGDRGRPSRPEATAGVFGFGELQSPVSVGTAQPGGKTAASNALKAQESLETTSEDESTLPSTTASYPVHFKLEADGDYGSTLGRSRSTPIADTDRRRRKTQQHTKTQPSKSDQLQVIRTVQLLNILLKQQKHQALEHSRTRGAKINPTKLAVSYEDLLARVNERRSSPAADREAARSEEGLSWAAALVLAIPPSLLAIVLAHHIAKRQAGSGAAGLHKDFRSGQTHLSGSSEGFDVDSESSYSLEDELLRAEGEAASYVEYNPRRPGIIRKSHRLFKGGPASMAVPRIRVRHNPHQEYYHTFPEPMPRNIGDAFDQPYRSGAYRRKAGSYGFAQPLSHEVGDNEELGGPAWAFASAGDAEEMEEFRMHGGL